MNFTAKKTSVAVAATIGIGTGTLSGTVSAATLADGFHDRIINNTPYVDGSSYTIGPDGAITGIATAVGAFAEYDNFSTFTGSIDAAGSTALATTDTINGPENDGPSVIGFNDSTGIVSGGFLEDGFSMELIEGHYDYYTAGGTDDSPYIGLDAASEFDDYATSRVRFTNGGLFDLVSFEGIWVTEGFTFMQVTSSAGGSSFAVNGTNSFAGPEWSNLNWLEFISQEDIAGPGIDTITVSTVPIPTTLWLFSSGLFGLIGIARKRKAT